ncbi:hypothetical protein NMD63_05605 [Edwardsiella tarda]|uniref:hypothetical protein n=1 Tax=Edwardsiella tarda TaxID=636 RepID=UPI00351C2201
MNKLNFAPSYDSSITEYNLTIDNFNIPVSDPLHPHFLPGEKDSDSIYICYKYYGEDSNYERRRDYNCKGFKKEDLKNELRCKMDLEKDVEINFSAILYSSVLITVNETKEETITRLRNDILELKKELKNSKRYIDDLEYRIEMFNQR